MEKIFDKLKNYKNVMIVGNFNINLLRCKENNSVNDNDFLDNILSNGYIPQIIVKISNSGPEAMERFKNEINSPETIQY